MGTPPFCLGKVRAGVCAGHRAECRELGI